MVICPTPDAWHQEKNLRRIAMKKKMLLTGTFALMLIIASLGTGCKSSPSSQPTPRPNQPAWMYDKPPKDEYWGIGYAKLTNDYLAMETASTRASREIARNISQLVQGLLTDYAREAGLANDPSSIMHIERIGRNLINVNLSGARINIRELMPDGAWYVRVAVPISEIMNDVSSAYDNEASGFAEWKREEALKRLDSMLGSQRKTPVNPEN